MDEKEKRLVDQTVTALQQQQWATERSVERLANMLWDVRAYLPHELTSRIEFTLSHLPRLQKVRAVDDREGRLERAELGYLGPWRWMLMCQFPDHLFSPADPFRYEENLRQLCEILGGGAISGDEQQAARASAHSAKEKP